MPTKTVNGQRLYFVDGPARGRSVLRSRQPSRLTWNDDHGAVHRYRRVTRFGSAHFYRYAA